MLTIIREGVKLIEPEFIFKCVIFITLLCIFDSFLFCHWQLYFAYQFNQKSSFVPEVFSFYPLKTLIRNLKLTVIQLRKETLSVIIFTNRDFAEVALNQRRSIFP